MIDRCKDTEVEETCALPACEVTLTMQAQRSAV